ncbi:MAG TPA: hypothetical protein GXX15_13135 [Clostridia bacterium]|nr:hypothetical protein [Clostridia bacterium]
MVLKGKAPDVLFDLPSPDRVFIGGTGDKAEEIFEAVDKRLKEKEIVVINAITLETAYIASSYFTKKDYGLEVVNVNISVSKKAGEKTMMIARNPIYIITAQKEG